MSKFKYPGTSIFSAFLISLGVTSSAGAEEPIEGVWQREDGTIIQYAKADDGQYCGIVLNTSFSGQSIGCMAGSGVLYEGKINKLDVGKTYDGKAEIVDPDTLKITGCALGGVICRSEDFTRQ